MRDERLYLADIVEATDAIGRFVAGMTEDDWIEDEVKQGAVMYQLVIIGEAAARLSKEFRECHSEIEWVDIIGFRSFAVHAYFAVSWSVVWVTATKDVPALAAQVTAILARKAAGEPALL